MFLYYTVTLYHVAMHLQTKAIWTGMVTKLGKKLTLCTFLFMFDNVLICMY